MKARWILSARDSGAWLTEQPAPLPTDVQGPEAGHAGGASALWVDTSRRFQAIEGFGGAFTEAAAVTWLALPPEARAQFLADCFDPVRGHGYTLGRVHMNSCDFSLGNYAHVEQPGDFGLAGFSIARDRQALLPFIQAALQVAGRPVRLLVSPWSPPAWMKTNGEMNHGGRLKPECRAAWAQCYVRFIRAYEAEGVPVWAVSVQNEPMARQRWDSCLYSAEEERDFVRDHLGPALHEAGLGHVKIVIWDHNRDLMVERASVVYGDPDAARYVWGTGFHWYGNEHFDHVQLVHDAWPDKALLFTEGCQEGGPHIGSWEVGERYARSIINDLNRWTVGWIDWNLLLDEQGGPNHVGNFCSAPVLADRGSGRLMHQSAHAVLGHFARFVRPGARRVLCASPRAEVEATAFVHPEGDTAVVAANRHGHGVAMRLVIDRMSWAVDLPAHSISTFVISE
ncbi:MAG: glucosylceramidase [Burkholderiales bacterium]|nr:MAG: glucosylceramidase [Burkholderiales bacterium]